MLPVPYISQIDEGRLAINDCGPASALMVARAYGHALGTSIDDLYRRYGWPDAGLYVSTIMGLLRDLGVPNSYRRGSLPVLRGWLDAGLPPILLVDLYGGHFVVATGYHAGGFTMHDPYWRGDAGRHITISDADMERIWGPHGQYHYTAIVPASPLTGDDMADINAAKAALQAAQAEIGKALAALGDAQGGPQAVTVRKAVNFRSQPNTTSAVRRLMQPGEQLAKLGEVSGEFWGGSALWYRLRDKSGVEGYAHASFF